MSNVFDPKAVAISTNAEYRLPRALSAGTSSKATSLYIDGYPMTLTLATERGRNSDDAARTSPARSLLAFNAGDYKLEEISIWSMARAQYQVLDDMFGRLVPGATSPSSPST